MADEDDKDSILTFEQFISYGTQHFQDLVNELSKPNTNGDQLMTDWVHLICEMKNDFPVARDYFALMFNAMNDIYHAFEIKKNEFPTEFIRCEQLMKAMWSLSDGIRLTVGGEGGCLEKEFKNAMTDSWINITNIADRNLTIQWGGLLYNLMYSFSSNFEEFARGLLK